MIRFLSLDFSACIGHQCPDPAAQACIFLSANDVDGTCCEFDQVKDKTNIMHIQKNVKTIVFLIRFSFLKPLLCFRVHAGQLSRLAMTAESMTGLIEY